MIDWSLVAISQCKLKNETSFYITRAFLSIFEGGFIYDAILLLSRFFTTAELAIRFSWVWVSWRYTPALPSSLS